MTSGTTEDDAEKESEEGLPRFRRIVRVGVAEPVTALLSAVRLAGVRMRRVAPVTETLEDVFHRLMSGRATSDAIPAARSIPPSDAGRPAVAPPVHPADRPNDERLIP